MTRYVLYQSQSQHQVLMLCPETNKIHRFFLILLFYVFLFYFYFLRTLLLKVYSLIYEFRLLTAIPQDNIFIRIYFLPQLFFFIYKDICISPFSEIINILRYFHMCLDNFLSKITIFCKDKHCHKRILYNFLVTKICLMKTQPKDVVFYQFFLV